MKYLRVTNVSFMKGLASSSAQREEVINSRRSGAYMWAKIFDGDIKYPSEVEDYESYDVVHINVCGGDLGLVQDVRSKIPAGSGTKIVVNLDYSPEEAQSTLLAFPHTYRRELKGADHYFGTEYFTAAFLARLVGQRVDVIPHPVDVGYLSSLDVKEGWPLNLINVLYHAYDNQIDLPYWVISGLGLGTGILGLPDDQSKNRANIVKMIYDFPMRETDWDTWIRLLQKSKILYEPYTQHSYGRATAEAAALGVPCVGSNLVDSMRRCYPETCCDFADIPRARTFIKKLNEDSEFYSHVSEQARDASWYYDFKNCKKLFEEMLV